MPRAPRLLLAAGGTGGHLFPGVAVAEFAQRQAGAKVLFVGHRRWNGEGRHPATWIFFTFHSG